MQIVQEASGAEYRLTFGISSQALEILDEEFGLGSAASVPPP